MARAKPRRRSKAKAFEPIESRCFEGGFSRVAGLDEAGRGCLAGPVVAAAVILPLGIDIPGLNDSKLLSADAREALYPVIFEVALGVGVGVGSLEDIESLNILHASLLAMVRAAEALPLPPDYLLIDGNQRIPIETPQETLIKGDSRSISVAAASIIAKVHRDRLMVELAKEVPGYGFEGHKGYGTAAHREAIARLGPSPHHRRTFRGVREHLPAPAPEPEPIAVKPKVKETKAPKSASKIPKKTKGGGGRQGSLFPGMDLP